MDAAYLYILRNLNGKFYVGSTDNLKRRIEQHKSGHTQTTRNMGDIKLVFSQKYDTLLEARQIERKLKRFKRKDFIEKIIADGYIKIKS